MTTTNNRHPSRMTPPGCVVVSFAPIAQWIEQRSSNPPVAGSSPAGRARFNVGHRNPGPKHQGAVLAGWWKRGRHLFNGPDVKPETGARAHSLARYVGTKVCESGFGATIQCSESASAPLRQNSGRELDNAASPSRAPSGTVVAVNPRSVSARPAATHFRVAQLVERSAYNRRVAGSSPAAKTAAEAGKVDPRAKPGMTLDSGVRQPGSRSNARPAAPYFSDPSLSERVGGGSFSTRIT